MLQDIFLLLLDIHFLILFDVCRSNIDCQQNGTDDDIGEICFPNGKKRANFIEMIEQKCVQRNL